MHTFKYITAPLQSLCMWWPIKERPHLTWNWSFSLLFKLSGAYSNQPAHTEKNISSFIQGIEVTPTHSRNFYEQSSHPRKNSTKQIISCHQSGWIWFLTQFNWGRGGSLTGHPWAFESQGHRNLHNGLQIEISLACGERKGCEQEASVWEFKKGPKLDQKYGLCPKVFLVPKAARQGNNLVVLLSVCASRALSSIIR